MTQVEAQFLAEHGKIDFSSTTAYSSGEVIQTTDGRAGVVLGLKAVASGDQVTIATAGRFDVWAATGTTFADGEMVWWDKSANLAINEKSIAASDDFPIGRAYKAKASGPLVVSVDLNVGVASGKINFTGTTVQSVSVTTTSSFTLRTSEHSGKIILLTSTAGSQHKRIFLPKTSLATCGSVFTIINGIGTLRSDGITIRTSAGIKLNGSSRPVESTSRAARGAMIRIVRVGTGYYTMGTDSGSAIQSSLVWVVV